MKDLFDDYENQPIKLKSIIDKYIDKMIDGFTYNDCNELLKEVQSVGYTFDYGLDATPYGLRPINIDISELDLF